MSGAVARLDNRGTSCDQTAGLEKTRFLKPNSTAVPDSNENTTLYFLVYMSYAALLSKVGE